MKPDRRNQCAEDLLALLPLYHKKILCPHPHISGMQVAQFRVLGVLMNEGTLSMSEIGKRLYISKPYMTSLAVTLIEGGFVVRQPDPEDRRVINIAITDAGKDHISQALAIYRSDVKGILAGLAEEDLDALCTALATVRHIFEKIP
jgi:DNA-binding MarR family transcriptional regulator